MIADPLLSQPRQRTRHAAANAGSTPEKKKDKPILQFIGSGFRYNGRVALAVLPGLASLLLFGGSSVLTVLFCTLFVVYLLDLFDKPHSIFLAVWSGMAIINLLMFSKGIPLVQISFVNIFIVAIFSLSVLLFAVWISMQFRWLQESSASAMILLERILFSLSPCVFSLLTTYAIMSFVNIIHGPFILLAVLCYIQYLLNQPLHSCFKPSENQLICNRVEMIVHSVSLVALPVLFHIGLFHRNFFIMYHMANLLAVLSFAGLFFSYTNRFSLLRDLGMNIDVDAFSKTVTVTSGLVLVFCFEYRVVFGAFYYSIPFPAPLSYIFVTIGCYTAAGLGYLFIIGEAKKLGRLYCSIIASVCAFTTGTVMGMGILCLPIFITASVFLVSFYFYRKAVDYIVFCVLSTAVVIWFVLRSYWFLQFDFFGVSLQFVCILIVFLAVLALTIPANVFAPQRGPIMAIYALAFTAIETILFFNALSDIYPYYMVLFTSCLGIWVTIHLENNKFISRTTSWICISAYISKLIMILAISRENVIGAFILTLSVLAPYYLHNYKAQSLSKQMGFFYSILYGVVTMFTTVYTSGSIIMVLIDRIPPESMLWGCYLATWGACCLALSFVFYPNSIIARRVSSTLTILGMSLLLIDPEFGLFVSVGSLSPLLLIFGVLITLMCSQSRYPGVRLFYVISMSIGCSILLVNTTLPSSMNFYICFSLIFLPFFIITNWLSFPSTLSTKGIPVAYIFFIIMFFVALAVGSITTKSYPPRIQGEYIKQIRSATMGLYAGMSIFMALLIKLKLSNNAQKPVKTPFDQKYLSEIGNISTLIGYGLSCYFCLFSLGHSEASMFLLAPILLLLSKDSFLFYWLNEANRYAPVVGFATGSLFAMSIYKIGYIALIRWKWRTLLVKEIIFLLSVFPSNYLFTRYLTSLRTQPLMWWLLVAPLNFIGIFATFSTTYWLAIEGLLLSVAYFILVFVVYRKDKKNII